MRKLLLFGLLGGIFCAAFALERLFTAPVDESKSADNKARFVVGGGAPRSVPEAAPPIVVDDAAVRAAVAKTRERNTAPVRSGAERGTPDANAARIHEVADKETLWTIAARELGSGARCKELAQWNGLAPDATLRIGTKLRLAPPAAAEKDAAKQPSKAERSADKSGVTDQADPDRTATDRTHTLAKGETLSKLAARYLGDAGRWREIQSLNKIADPANVPEGSVLKIPRR
ncbi:MAG: LysM domain-containing protein [Planctomycetes bacterium]|nr:LysM domain-containing protein [Planctomycetota bacterium]